MQSNEQGPSQLYVASQAQEVELFILYAENV